MSMNQLIRQGLNMVETMAAMPFQVVRRLWARENSEVGQIINHATSLGEGMATMPVRFVKEFFEDQKATGTTTAWQANSEVRQQPGPESPPPPS